MKKSFIIVLAILALCSLAYSQVKIGVINAQEIIGKTKKGIAIQNKLEGLQQKKQNEIESLQNQIKTLQKDLASPALNRDTREAKTRELEDQRIKYQRVVQDAQKAIQLESQKELMTLQQEIMPLIQEIGKAKGFTLILDVTSSGIAYFDTAIDITPEVITAVDAKFPAGK